MSALIPAALPKGRHRRLVDPQTACKVSTSEIRTAQVREGGRSGTRALPAV